MNQQQVNAAHASRLKPPTEPDYRAQHAEEIALIPSDIPGVKKRHVLDPLKRLYNTRKITCRQMQAGENLRDTADTVEGIRNPRDLFRADESAGDYSFEDKRRDAVRKKAKCVKAAGVLWPLVQAVAIEGISLTKLAASRQARKRQPILLDLRRGLDRIGDVYGIPSDFFEVEILHGGIPKKGIVSEDSDGVWRSKTLDRKPWVAHADRFIDLYRMAQVELKRRQRAGSSKP